MTEMLASLEHLVRTQQAGAVLFGEGDRGATIVDGYSTYLALKQRFEYED